MVDKKTNTKLDVWKLESGIGRVLLIILKIKIIMFML